MSNASLFSVFINPHTTFDFFLNNVHFLFFILFIIALVSVYYLFKIFMNTKVINFNISLIVFCLVAICILTFLNNLLIGYEFNLIYGHIKITNLNYKLFLLINYINIFFFTLLNIKTPAVYKNKPYYIYMFIFVIITPCIYSINSTLGFFFFIEFLSLVFFFLLTLQIQYTCSNFTSKLTYYNSKSLQLIFFKKNFFTVNIYFWITALVSLIFYVWYYYYVYSQLNINWFSYSSFYLIDYKNYFYDKFNIIFFIFILLKGGWIPFFIWKLMFIKYINTNMLFIYLLFYYFIIFIYLQLIVNLYLYYFLLNSLQYLLGFMFIFILYIGHMSYSITSFNLFLAISSALNAFIIVSLLLICQSDICSLGVFTI